MIACDEDELPATKLYHAEYLPFPMQESLKQPEKFKPVIDEKEIDV
ncbi:MAG: hypothetical protein K1X28_07965 [Parachlamydiales bacterium]|nr:hypothetical protein [Parachlamydiales bacterium]